jgi:N-methylhydantoinase A
MTYYIGVDTGGTFTDVVILDDKGTIIFDKALSTPDNPALGVMNALTNAAALLNADVSTVLADAARFAHGTTVATNALINRRGAKVGLITTVGFEDTTIIARGPMGRTLGVPIEQTLDYIYTERAEPLVPKALIRGVRERVDLEGDVIAPINQADVEQAVKELLGEGVDSIAVCLMWSFRNRTHEDVIKETIGCIGNGTHVSLSSEVAPVIGEFERANTAIVNAYIAPRLSSYINDLQERLEAQGFKWPVQVMKNSGGACLPSRIGREAVSIIDSGPVAGLIASQYFGKILGYDNALATDMGGTSFDVGVIYRGEPAEEKMPFVDHGLPVRAPRIKEVGIGAGGGSIAWTEGQRLMVGPHSAGASPGPVCYGQGGTAPTVTDALVVLGILDPDNFFGGRMKLDKAAAEAAIQEGVAGPLNMTVLEAAAGIYDIVTAKMADLIRKVTVESGYDPREFALFAYGGASPAHVVQYGAALGIKEMIVPHSSAVFSALGCVLSDVKFIYEHSDPLYVEETQEFIDAFNGAFSDLESRVLSDVAASGIGADEVFLVRRLEVRYEGQFNEFTIPWHDGALSFDTMGQIREEFEERYEARFGQGASRSIHPVEVITFRMEAVKATEKPAIAQVEEAKNNEGVDLAKVGTRPVYLRRYGQLEAVVYDYDHLRAGHTLEGPAIIQRRDTLILVPPGYKATIDGYQNTRISAIEG